MLLAQQFGAALVEFVVADRAGKQPGHGQRLQGRLVGPHRAHGGTGADQVTGANHQQARVFLAPGLHGGGDIVHTTGLERAGARFGCAGVLELGGIEVAVEIIHADQIDVDRGCRARGATGHQASRRERCIEGADKSSHK